MIDFGSVILEDLLVFQMSKVMFFEFWEVVFQFWMHFQEVMEDFYTSLSGVGTVVGCPDVFAAIASNGWNQKEVMAWL